MAVLAIAASLLAIAGCRDESRCRGAACEDASSDAGTDASRDAGQDAGTDAGQDAGSAVGCLNLPPGLYVAGSCSTLTPNVRRFQPLYTLWSDAATKDRYVNLPPGSEIDATNPDFWVYPQGTIFWKHFSIGSTRVETRMLRKISAGMGAAAWEMRTFVWNSEQNEVTEVVNGLANALGTTHDIPTPAECARCHSTPDVSLGFTAIQLNHGLPNETSLAYLVSGATPILDPMPAAYPTGLDYATAAVVPGTAEERAAFGYLHTNCGQCHRESGEAAFMRLFVPVGSSVGTLPIFAATTGAVGIATTGWMSGTSMKRVDPHATATSAVYLRMGMRGDFNAMPPLATESVDTAGRTAVEAWIDSLP